LSAEAAGKIRELRLTNQIDAALRLASDELGKNQSAGLLAEAIRVLILKGQQDNAAALYRAFTSDPATGNNLEPEALVRLALQLERRELVDSMPVPDGPAWLVELLTSGEDPVGLFQPVSLNITVTNGPANYNFLGPCPHCWHVQNQMVATSLLVLRHWYCPACFGSVKLDLDTVRNVLEAQNNDLLERDFFELDAPLLDHIRPRLLGEVETEEIVQALGQEYIFLLNELIVWHQSAESGEGGA
jgi:hypothetical protein